MRHRPQPQLRRSRSVQILFDNQALEGVGCDIQVERGYGFAPRKLSS